MSCGDPAWAEGAVRFALMPFRTRWPSPFKLRAGLTQRALDRALQIFAAELDRRVDNFHPVDLNPVQHIVREWRHFALVNHQIRQAMLTESA